MSALPGDTIARCPAIHVHSSRILGSFTSPIFIPMRYRLLIFATTAALLSAATGCSPTGEACGSDSDCKGSRKCLTSGGVVFGSGVCVLPCATERLAQQCRDQGGRCNGDYCISAGTDADAITGDGGADSGDGTGPPDTSSADTCIRPSDYDFCLARGLPCGNASGRDRCGNQRSVDCSETFSFNTEERHCGACGHTCDFQHADGNCIDGTCETYTCDPGYKNKDGEGDNGCECEVTDEVCDGKDNDCDSDIDEGCDCTAGETDGCYNGPEGTAGEGICHEGERTCQSDGTWGPCMNQRTPASDEDCGNDSDDDCNGATNDGCGCNYKGKSDGVCTDQRVDGNGNCTKPGNYESDESSCDGADNDCDGRTDEGLMTDTFYRDRDGDGYGDSSPTTSGCSNPNPDEWADNDDDCDDDASGVNPGEMEKCSTPGTDDNCDGAINENCPCDYDSVSEGVCDNATRDSDGNCQEPSDYETTESTCDDGADNDCDGASDMNDSDCY